MRRFRSNNPDNTQSTAEENAPQAEYYDITGILYMNYAKCRQAQEKCFAKINLLVFLLQPCCENQPAELI